MTDSSVTSPEPPFEASLEGCFEASLAFALGEVLANDLACAVRLWDDATATRVGAEVRDELARLPIPAFQAGAFELVRMRDRLLLVLGALDARAGDPAPLLAAARREWVRGSSHAAYLHLLHDHGQTDAALALALSLLEEPPVTARVDEAPAIRAFVHEALALPPGFESALAALGDAPSLDAWLALGRFSPAAHAERAGPRTDRRSTLPPRPAPSPDRARYTLLRLLALGVDPDALFPLVASDGTSEVLERFVERGLVRPATIVAFAAELARHERAVFFGLAFRAAAVRGEAFLARRHLRDARAAGRSPLELDEDLAFARARGDATVRLALAAVSPPSGSPDLDV